MLWLCLLVSLLLASVCRCRCCCNCGSFSCWCWCYYSCHYVFACCCVVQQLHCCVGLGAWNTILGMMMATTRMTAIAVPIMNSPGLMHLPTRWKLILLIVMKNATDILVGITNQIWSDRPAICETVELQRRMWRICGVLLFCKCASNQLPSLLSRDQPV